ncbi:glycoside hydrolase family protein [Nocardiopsis aegyptia]|uniref:beta-fructofuranosidase n=1 Tax=Nocardiopsis aegyptia TaxID=220378 RepID=A0A7Z0EHS1_9ACTN|nr:hypothetical protein [Nocardiopsis aegyptia]NYJ32303.1 putative GH43/DUF377 family glycosyl hydrolase [Nocardiopsis aegyptia]
MRYAPPGACLNDFALLPGPPYVLLHLQAPWTEHPDVSLLETSYGRAVSHDLVHWEPLAPAFGVGRPGDFDDTSVWTMHPLRHGDGWTMAYTGVHDDGHKRQAVGLARTRAEDGSGWRRVPGTVVRPDARWYRAGEQEAWRDPWIVEPEGGLFGARYAMLVCARTAHGPVERSGCVGLAVSDDLRRWTVRPPLLVPGDVDELECPVLERVPGGWLLLGSVGPSHHIEAWRAERLDGSWERLGPLAPPGPYAPRLVDGPGGERLLLHTVQRRYGLDDGGAACRGMLAQPKVLETGPDDRPRLTWWPGVESHLGPALAPGDTVWDAVVDVAVEGGPARIVLRGEDAGFTVDLDPGALRVRGPAGGRETALEHPVAHLRALLFGEYLELYADGVLVACEASYATTPGPCLARGADHRPLPVTVRRVADPYPDRDDVSVALRAPRPDQGPPRRGPAPTGAVRGRSGAQ